MRTGSTASLPSLISLVSSAVCSWTLASNANAQHQQQVAPAPQDRFQRGLLDVRVAHRAELRADAHPDGRAGVRLALGLDVLAGEGVEPGEGDALLLVRPLHAGLAEIVEDHLAEVCGRGERGRGGRGLVGRRHGRQAAVRRQALHGERPGQPDDALVLVGLVVQRLGVGVPGNRLVDLFAGHALLDVGVVGDALERDVRHGAVDEPLVHVALRGGGVGVGVRAGKVGLLLAALGRVGEQVVGEAGGHEAGAGQGQGDAGRVDGDPPPAPLLRDVGRRAAAARRVENEVAGVRRHQEAALDRLGGSLDDDRFSDRRTGSDLQYPSRHCRVDRLENPRDNGRTRAFVV